MFYDPVLVTIAAIAALVTAAIWLRGSSRGPLLIRVRSRPTMPAGQSHEQRISASR